MSPFLFLWIANALLILPDSSISITSTVPKTVVEGTLISGERADNGGILTEGENLLYPLGSVTLIWKRVTLILNTFYSP